MILGQQRDNPKVITVLWSGGFDSTFLLLDECKRASEKPNEIYIQCVTTIFANCGKTKNDREKEARNKIKRYIRRTYPSVHIKYAELEMNYNDEEYRFNSDNEGLVQPIVWACSLIPLLNKDTTMKMGYIKYDDALSPMFKNQLQDLLDTTNKLTGKNIKFELPLSCTDKTYILSELIEYHPEIIEYCTTCENPGSADYCGRCATCQSLKKSLVQLLLAEDKNIRERIATYLKDWFNISAVVQYGDIDVRMNKTSEESTYDANTNNSVNSSSSPTPNQVYELAKQVHDEINDALNTDADPVMIKPVDFEYRIEHTPYRFNKRNWIFTDYVSGEVFPTTVCFTKNDARIELDEVLTKIKRDITEHCSENIKFKVDCVDNEGLHKLLTVINDQDDIIVFKQEIDIYARRRAVND